MAVLIVATALGAGEASAQIYERPRMESAAPVLRPGFGGDLRQIGGWIRDGRRSGQLTRGEARALRRELRAVGGLQARYATGGLSDTERAELAARVEGLRGLTIARRTTDAK